ncbi:MAG TPA: hypothetical protein VH189_11410 [Rhizomicrobium sp.]|nr:hypothetical protein [Rhizomicrobium sp.]
MRLFLMAATAAGFAFATALMMADEAAAVQDTPTTINGVEAVCTGVGSAKDDPRWSAYPVKIVLSTPGGANLANAHISLMKGNQEMAGLDCDAPWILFKPPAGSYTATASLIGGSHSAHASFTTSGSGQKEVTLVFPRGEQPTQ